MSVVFHNKFWPEPKTPAKIRITLTIDQKSTLTWSYKISIFINEAERAETGELEAQSELDAEQKTLYKAINYLGEILAEVAP